MSTINLTVKKFLQEGNLAHEYQPLRNILLEDGSISDFNTDELKLDLNNPLNIECQPSYDGTVNLIINDDKNPPRIINTRFTKLEDNRYKIINRNQIQQTNLYQVGKIDQQTRLFRNINKIPKIDLVNLGTFGQLKGGNYTFYIKFADNDYNKTDIVAESGVVSVFKGSWSDPTSVSGTLQDELTDKSITLNIYNIDTSFASIYVYFVRQYSDVNGAPMEEYGMFKEAYPIKNTSENITLNGFEEVENIGSEELNIKYNLVTNVKTQAQVQNMLFFGNVEGINLDLKTLQNISYFINVKLKQDTEGIGWVDEQYQQEKQTDLSKCEYYNPNYIYYKLGYWPDEIYRLGIVYIMNDDSLSPVFNLRGRNFDAINKNNIDWYNNTIVATVNKYENAGIDSDNKIYYNKNAEQNYKDNINVYKYETLEQSYDDNGIGTGRYYSTGKYEMNWIPKNDYIENSQYLDNTFGVFKNPKINLNAADNNPISSIIDYKNSKIKPWYYEFSINNEIIKDLKKLGVKGYFIVRQKRIMTTLCQGLTGAVDRTSYVPMLTMSGDKETWFTESFLSKSRLLTTDFSSHKVTTNYKQSTCIYTLDPVVTPLLQSIFDGSQFIINYTSSKGELKIAPDAGNRHFYFKPNVDSNEYSKTIKGNCLFVDEDVPIKFMDNFGFSSRAGTQEDVKQFSFFSEKDFKGTNRNLLRGIWSSYLGTNVNIPGNTIVDIKVGNYSELFLKDYFNIRGKDNSEFFAISERFAIDDSYKLIADENKKIRSIPQSKTFDVYRGDCYVSNVTMRLNRNFIDSEVPINDIIVDNDTWSKNYKGYMGETKSEDWVNINKADLNTVPLGMWLTFKCLSNYNLNLRSEDRQNTDEMALMGNPRSFYPLSDASTAVSYKISESKLHNPGYNTTVGKKRNLIAPNLPYVKDLYDNRIMFSNVQVDDDFRNAYRVFQGLSYEDIDRQYGAIVKLIPWGVNLLCVFEHGIGIVPINEKALMQTTTGQNIHLYGAGVIQKQLSLISPDFGSIWPESIIRTPIGIYGVDTYAKKIWRYTDYKGFETISDMKIQRFLNDHVKLDELDKYPIIGLRNVKAHYNNYKGDVMFTFYNFTQEEEWNFCFNERMDKWVTRYSWTPLYSENINNIFYSLDKKRVEVLSHIYNNKHVSSGLNTSENEWKVNNESERDPFITDLILKGYSLADDCIINITNIETSCLDKDGIEHKINFETSLDENGIKIMNPAFQIIHSYNINQYSNKLQLDWTLIKDQWNGLIKKLEINTDFTEPLYYMIDVTSQPKIIQDGIGSDLKSFNTRIGIVVEPINEMQQEQYDKLLINGFYVHGRAGVFDEMSYDSPDKTNRIFPTKWYDKQEPFEFEFVVNGDELGMHKIFDNLVIISNNVEPDSFEFSIIGDVYSDMYRLKTKEQIYKENDTKFFKNTTVEWDPILNHYILVTNQKAKNFNNPKYGRRLGNITYKEDSWYTNIEPIKFNTSLNADHPRYGETRIRDKYIKIRIRYKGDKLAIITALRSLYRLSFS